MGRTCGRGHRVAWLMREAGLRFRSRKRWRLVSSNRHDLPIAPNHLARQFASGRANRHWGSDMIYVRTIQGWLYLAVVLDLSTCVLGDTPSHASGPDARRAGNGCTPPATGGSVLHLDRGSHYCAYDYQALLRRYRIIPSHSTLGYLSPMEFELRNASSSS